MARSGAAAGVLALSASGCAVGDDDGDVEDDGDDDVDELGDVTEGEGSVDGVIVDGEVPSGAAMFGLVNEIFDQGIRRPGYDADVWLEEYCVEHFRSLGMENVRLEPVRVTRWEPERWSLHAQAEGAAPVEIDCFPVPYGPPVDDLDVELAAFDPDDPGRVAGKASLYETELLEVPADTFLGGGGAPDDLSGRVVDPDDTLGDNHLLPFGTRLGDVLEPSVDAGAAAFIGTLTGYPGNSHQYYVPYDGETRPIPGVWISHSDGERLHRMLAGGPVRIRMSIDSTSRRAVSNNVVGELPGADDDVVMIGSHHDGPWASAVEDATGVVLVLAQADYWAAQPAEHRPHRLVFVLQAGHMDGGAGLKAYIDRHREELDRVVLQVHLEHAALECVEDADGTVVPTDRPVPRWFFTSRIPRLEEAVIDALRTEEVHRSMLLAPDAILPQPPTDGAYYYNEGVPVMHFLAAPFYLFDAMDTPDKVDQDGLVPLTRATIRIVASTAGVSAATMRAMDLHPYQGAGGS